ncbi:MAG: endolytic transglycosylase MltG [Acidobacteriota bacterium]|nr:endolytic transglycosylase MltG [Blastocatellia bacterium]MDW8412553.1 endolytic transglycosylase MltG [Acidobacteriota bacterium]
MRLIWKCGLGLAVAVIFTCLGLYLWVDAAMKRPHFHTVSEVLVIEPGLGRKAIVKRLVEAGVLTNRIAVLLYLTLKPQNLQAGEYKFESPITPLAVLEKLRRGEITTEQVTIPEGSDIYDVEVLLTGINGATRSEVRRALRKVDLIADIDPAAETLEGYLYPDTYSYTTKTTPQQLVAAMVRRFRQIWHGERRSKAAALGLTTRQVITLASLIEEEAKVDEERALISAVFHNRLKRGMKLDCDPTFIYAAKLEEVWDGQVNNPLHRRRNSPYNTYLFSGLPPGPISSPQDKSIDAALNPASVDYLYFVVSGSEGRHKFSRTMSEHIAAVAEYRKRKND